MYRPPHPRFQKISTMMEFQIMPRREIELGVPLVAVCLILHTVSWAYVIDLTS